MLAVADSRLLQLPSSLSNAAVSPNSSGLLEEALWILEAERKRILMRSLFFFSGKNNFLLTFGIENKFFFALCHALPVNDIMKSPASRYGKGDPSCYHFILFVNAMINMS